MADLVGFAKAVATHCFDGGPNDLEYENFTDLALKYGVIVEEVYDPKKHGDVWAEEWDMEPGDTLYQIVSPLVQD